MAEILQVPVVESIGARNVLLVPPLPVPGLVAADQHDRAPARIEYEQGAEVRAAAQFFIF